MGDVVGEGCGSWPQVPRTAWRDDFPAVVASANYRSMMDHSAYRAAKDGISDEDALALAIDLISDQAVDKIREIVRGKSARLVAVHAEERQGRNKIPMAYAETLSDILEIPTDPGIVQASVANHGSASSIYHRMVSPPQFHGYVEQNANYVLVDDTCTAGGTLANLKGFIEVNGGKVICMSVLSGHDVHLPYYISLMPNTLARLNRRHRDLSGYWEKEFGYGLECLTEGEAGHLLTAPSVDTIRNRLIEARRDLDIDADERADSAQEVSPNEGDDKTDGRT